MKKIFFNEEDEKRILEAIKEAENKTSGEIVLYIINRSDNYAEANFKSALLFGSIPIFVFMLLSLEWLLPVVITPFEIGIIFICCCVLGFVLALFVPKVKRFFISQEEMLEQVMKRASVAFIDEDIVDTKSRNGILIYISFFERRAVVLADKGINNKVPTDYWKDVVQIISDNFKKGNKCEGIVQAIIKCSDILVEAGFAKGVDDENELRDDVKIKNE
ncbi:MAG: TPM domain-containing protein [Ignavibacteriales bacterium]|nr:TPM domain-containing protein [Ignavibacteriales bacterium]